MNNDEPQFNTYLRLAARFRYKWIVESKGEAFSNRRMLNRKL